MRFLAVGVLLPAALAQTFVVDASNGPGTQFTTIASAVAAVPDGATLLVRPGVYFEFSVTQKGITILADPGVTVAMSPFGIVTVSQLAAGQRVVMRGLRLISGTPSGAAGCSLQNCLGPVVLDGVFQPQQTTMLLQITACDRVLVRDYRMDGSDGSVRVQMTNSHAVFENCELGFEVNSRGPQTPGITQQGGTLQLIDSSVRGFWGLSFGPSPEGVLLNGGDARLLGTSEVLGGFAAFTPGPGLAMGGTGSVRLEPTVALSGAAPLIAPTIVATTSLMPRVTNTANGPVTVITTSLDGPPGHLGVIALALLGPRVGLPGVADAVWLDGATISTVAFGVLAPGTPLTSQLVVPAGLPSGLPAGWQGVTFDPSGTIALSNPSFRTLP